MGARYGGEPGTVLAAGPPGAVITPALIRQLYEVDCALLPDPVTGTPIIVGVQRAAPAPRS